MTAEQLRDWAQFMERLAADDTSWGDCTGDTVFYLGREETETVFGTILERALYGYILAEYLERP